MTAHSNGAPRTTCQRIISCKFTAPAVLLLLFALLWGSQSLLFDANTTEGIPQQPPVHSHRHRHSSSKHTPVKIPDQKETVLAVGHQEGNNDGRILKEGEKVQAKNEPAKLEKAADPVKDIKQQSTAVPRLVNKFAGLQPDEILQQVTDFPEVTFLSIGDWGRNTPQKTLLADAMANWSENEHAAFILSCGDSFYNSPTHKNHGISSVNDPYIKECFEDVFHHAALQRKWFISIGNHDYPPHAPSTNIKAQVQYTNISKRWFLPAPYYTYRVQAKGWSAEIFVLDHYDPKEYDTIKGPTPYPVQLPWLDKKLQESTADWKIVLCHRPFYSSGSWHGSYPLWKKAIYPILMKHRVQIYFAGDDHILEALKDASGLVHIVSGAGSHMHNFGRTDRNSLFKFREHGFTLHKMNRTHLQTNLLDYHGKVLYSFTTAQDEVRPKRR